MKKADWQADLGPGLEALGIRLPADATARLLQFVELLQHWNQAYNLTAVRDPAEMVVKHLLDSLAVLPYVRGTPVEDVGAGAGLPGIPLAIALPDTRFVLLDSNGKKTRFMVQAAASLKLHNVEVVQSRAEGYRPAEPFATVISRAFASLGEFLRLAGQGCASGGRLLAMKGAYPDEELRDIPEGFRLLGVHALKVPGLDAERCVVEIEKL
jgi:16S rRNA (guanine527-N7)-methyltransferase